MYIYIYIYIYIVFGLRMFESIVEFDDQQIFFVKKGASYLLTFYEKVSRRNQIFISSVHIGIKLNEIGILFNRSVVIVDISLLVYLFCALMRATIWVRKSVLESNNFVNVTVLKFCFLPLLQGRRGNEVSRESCKSSYQS
jgi:hypothetical protein